MFDNVETDTRRILMISGLFALIGILALVAVFVFSPNEASRSDLRALYGGFATPEEELAAKHEVLENLAAMQEVDEKGKPTEAAKLKVLGSLQSQ